MRATAGACYAGILDGQDKFEHILRCRLEHTNDSSGSESLELQIAKREHDAQQQVIAEQQGIAADALLPLIINSVHNAFHAAQLYAADVEGSNRKGRTALSFAAAPSMDGSTRRNTPVTALQLLLQSGA